MSDLKQNKPQIAVPENVPVDYNFERMLKSFLKQVQKDGILEEIRERRYYNKPSEIRHRIEAQTKRKRELERRRRKKK